MSDEAKLTSDLTQLESKLRGISLPASRLNREEVLYQAGWEAACHQLASRHSKRLSRWFWPTSSCVLAATIALLLAVPGLRSAHENHAPLNANPSTGDELATRTTNLPANSARRSTRTVRPPVDYIDLISVRPLCSTSHLRFFRFENDEPVHDAAIHPIDFSSPPAKTRREILQEMLSSPNFLPHRHDTPCMGQSNAY